MTIKIFLLIMISVSLSAFAQISLKAGMNHSHVQEALISGDKVEKVMAILLNGYIILGLIMYFLSMVFWLLILSKIDVSVAYPFVGLGFIITMGLGFIFLNEQISMIRIIGTFQVVLGVLLVASTQYS